MSSYISFPLDRDLDDVLDEMYDRLRLAFPGWEPNDANLDTWILQLTASQAVDLLSVLTDIPDTIFRYFGRVLIGFADVIATQAQAPTTWTMVDTDGYTINEGTQVGVYNSNNQLIPFVTAEEIVIPSGQSATSAGAVTIVAIEPGETGSGLGSVGQDIELIDPLEFVQLVELTAATTGGINSETDEEYRARLVRRLRRLSTRPILPIDFSDMAQEIVGVSRALAIDGYIPGIGLGQERAIALSAIDENGAALSTGKKAEVDAYLQANREVNFIVNVIDPTFNTIDVTFTAVVLSGYDPVTIIDAAEVAVASYLSPDNWGRDPRFSDTGSEGTWVHASSVYYNELIQLIANVEGIDRVVTLQYAINPNALGVSSSLALVGVAPLTQPGTIIGAAI